MEANRQAAAHMLSRPAGAHPGLGRKDSALGHDEMVARPAKTPELISEEPDEQERPRQRVAWACLPHEVQVKVFRGLNVQDLLRCCTVSRGWYCLVFDGSLWADLNTAPFYKDIPRDQLLRLVSAAAGFLKTANFRGCAQLTSADLIALGDLCPNIQILSLKGVRNVSSEAIEYLLTHLAQLEVLDVSGLAAMNDSILNALIEKAAVAGTDGKTKIRSLNLSWCRNVTGKAIAQLVVVTPQIHHLSLSGCTLLEPADFRSIAMYVPHLETIDLAHTRFTNDQCIINLLYTLPCGTELSGTSLQRQKLHDPTFDQLPMRKLISLNLIHTPITDAALRHLARHPCSDTTLRHLQLAGCAQLTSSGLCDLAREATHLRYLDVEDIFQVTNETVECFAQYLGHLEHLTLSFCDAITDRGVIAILEASANASAASAASLVASTKLRGLCCLEVDNCWQLSDVLLDYLANMLNNDRIPTLRRLDIFDCRNVSWEAVQRVEQAGYAAWRKPSHLRRRYRQRQRTNSFQQQQLQLPLSPSQQQQSIPGSAWPMSPASLVNGTLTTTLQQPPSSALVAAAVNALCSPTFTSQPLIVKSYYNWQRTATPSRSDLGPDGHLRHPALGASGPMNGTADALAARYAAEHYQYARRRRDICTIL